MPNKPTARSHVQIATDQELNLIPMMNLICMLIPFLLLTAAFIRTAVINVQQPSFGPEPTPKQKATDTDAPRFTLTITDSGYLLFVDGKKLEGNDPSGPSLPRLPGGQYDAAGLRYLAGEIKAQDPTKASVILSAEPDVNFDELIDAMDAVRQDPERAPLFPDVVIANSI